MLLETLFSAVFLATILSVASYGLAKVNYYSNEISKSFKTDFPPKNCVVKNLTADNIIKCDRHIFIVNQKGISLLETIVSILICSLVITISIKESGFIISQSSTRKSQIDKLSSFNEWVSILHHSLINLDYSRNSWGFRFFKGSVTYADESLVSLSKPASLDSSGFVAASFFRTSRLVIENASLQSGTNIKKVCYDKSQQRLPPDFDAFILTDFGAIEGFCEIQIIAALSSSEKLCGLIDLHQIYKPVLIKRFHNFTDKQISDSARAIIPLSERYIYYLDNQQTLRRLQFEKEQIIESQPVKTLMHPIEIKNVFDYPTATYRIKLLDTDYVKTISRTLNSLSDLSLALTK